MTPNRDGSNISKYNHTSEFTGQDRGGWAAYGCAEQTIL